MEEEDLSLKVFIKEFFKACGTVKGILDSYYSPRSLLIMRGCSNIPFLGKPDPYLSSSKSFPTIDDLKEDLLEGGISKTKWLLGDGFTRSS